MIRETDGWAIPNRPHHARRGPPLDPRV